LFANKECGHTACEECWTKWAEDQVATCRDQRQLSPCCLTCSEPMCDPIWRHLGTQSRNVADLISETNEETKRLKKHAVCNLQWAASPCESGPVCWCGKRQLALLANPDCDHVACEHCWTKWAREQVPRCRSERMLSPPCLGNSCCNSMAVGIWRHACTLDTSVRVFAHHTQQEIDRMQKTASDVLVWASFPSKPGPTCPICCESHICLLANSACSHMACEDCWSRWAAEELPCIRRQKRASLRCFGPGCCDVVASEIWCHSVTRSDAVGSMDRQLAFRRRLQTNELYPPAVQVDCPRPGCLGLGYLGYDSVMCFICEHSWTLDSGERPQLAEVGEGVIAGEMVKQCPGCGEHIVKNGGCDHMTCRCRHQFWWSTLQPYRF